jgi:hypothetical protein
VNENARRSTNRIGKRVGCAQELVASTVSPFLAASSAAVHYARTTLEFVGKGADMACVVAIWKPFMSQTARILIELFCHRMSL